MTDIVGVNRAIQGLTEAERNERAQLAVKNFRAMQHSLTSYARALTGRKDVRVELDTGAPRTDGTRIFFRPPLALGNPVKHERRLCEKRGDNARLLCEACRVREEVMAPIYHEISHIAFDSFAPTLEQHKIALTQRAVEEWGSKYAEQIKARIDGLPAYLKNDYKSMSGIISPFLPPLVNALEDARVNASQFRARPGIKVMMKAHIVGLLSEGVEQSDGSMLTWSEQPTNAQVIVGCFVLGAGYEVNSEWFAPEVTAALSDNTLLKLCVKAGEARRAADVYEISFQVLARLRELGFCKRPEDPEEEEEDEPDLGDDRADDQPDSNPDGSDSDSEHEDPEASEVPTEEAGDQDESEEEDPVDEGQGAGGPDDSDSPAEEGEEESSDGAGEAGDSTGSDERTDNLGSGTEDDEPSEEGADESGEADSGAGMEEDGDPSTSVDEGGVDDGDPHSDQAGASDRDEVSEEAEGERGPSEGSEDGDRAGEPSAEGEAEEADPAQDGPAEDSSEGDEATGVDWSAGDDAGRREDSGAGGESAQPEESELTDGEPDAEGVPSEGEGDPFQESDSKVEGEGGIGNPDQPQSSPESEDEDEAEAFDMHGDEGQGGVEVEHPEGTGTPEEVEHALRLIENHEEPPKSVQADIDAANEAIDQAIIQGVYFETPSEEVWGVRVHREDEPGLDQDGQPCDNAWTHKRLTTHGITLRQAGVDCDMDVPESILGKALLHTRRVFQDNQAAKYEPNLRSGRVNARVLGRRAWHNDDRLFGKKRVPGKKSYAVLIGVDVSGSTVGINLALAKRAAMAQAELCQRAGVQFAVYAHTFNNRKGLPYEGDGMVLDIYEVKTVDEPWDTQRKDRLSRLGPDGGNLDGHTLEFYRKRLDEMEATDKIILYYTDGRMPASNYDEELEILQREIHTCKAKGYTLLGVGIRTDSPIRHGLDTVRVDTDEDLKGVVSHLEKRLAPNR